MESDTLLIDLTAFSSQFGDDLRYRLLGKLVRNAFLPEAFFREKELPGFYASLQQEAAFWHAPTFDAQVPETD